MVDIVIREAYLDERDAVVDIEIKDGRIRDVVPESSRTAPTELMARGELVSPGLVDAHVHLDMAHSAYAGRRPGNNDTPLEMEEVLEETAAYFASSSPETVKSNVRTVAEQAVGNGVLHVRSHGYVDSRVGADVVEWLLEARDSLAPLLDIEVVAFPQQGIRRDEGSKTALRRALGAGADLVGGLDPATLNNDRTQTVETWFDIATDYDVGLDVHIHERGTTGLETLERLAAKAIETGYQGRVTASHAFALADAATADGDGDTDGTLSTAVSRFQEAAMDFITCYQSTPTGMPIRRFHESGLGMAHGTDQVHDLWGAHGNIDALEAMLVESLKLDSYSTNRGLQTLWELITTRGADVLGIEGYGIQPGTPADIVVHDASSPQWAIVENRTPRYVIKEGTLVAEDGAVRERSDESPRA